MDKPAKRKFLGFSFYDWKEVTIIRIASESIKRFKDKIRKITGSRKRIKFIDLINELKLFLIGWKNYFTLARAQSIFRGLDEWIRRRLRSYIWQQLE